MNNRQRTLDTLEILGGSLCLDFTNTINSRRQPEHDYLTTYADLVNWSVKAGALPVEQANPLQVHAVKNDAEAQKALQKAISLRELLYQLFSKLAEHSEPSQHDLRAFLRFYAEAINQGSLQNAGDRFTFDWTLADRLDAILWPISYAAGELLLTDHWKRVKECPNCGWLFLDASKNQNRRWCNMNTCGAKEKMGRYHRKRRQLE